MGRLIKQPLERAQRCGPLAASADASAAKHQPRRAAWLGHDSERGKRAKIARRSGPRGTKKRFSFIFPH